MKDKIKFALGTVGIDLDLGFRLEEFALFGLHFSFVPHNSYKGSSNKSKIVVNIKSQKWIWYKE